MPDTVALRVPVNVGTTDYMKVRHETPFREFINRFVDGSRELERAGIRVPAVYARFQDQFVAVEKIESDFNFYDFFKEKVRVSPKVAEEAEEAFYRFAKTTAAFKRIGDFHPGQIVYNIKAKKWILLDFTEAHKPTSMIFGRGNAWEHPFQYFSPATERGMRMMDRVNVIFAEDSGRIARFRACVVGRLRSRSK
jgi:hypothetical protein